MTFGKHEIIMDQLKVFHDRLIKIGITTTFIGNAPWIYLETVNGKKVKGRYLGNHGFTAFWYIKEGTKITDIKTVFNKVRETLNNG